MYKMIKLWGVVEYTPAVKISGNDILFVLQSETKTMWVCTKKRFSKLQTFFPISPLHRILSNELNKV